MISSVIEMQAISTLMWRALIDWKIYNKKSLSYKDILQLDKDTYNETNFVILQPHTLATHRPMVTKFKNTPYVISTK